MLQCKKVQLLILAILNIALRQCLSFILISISLLACSSASYNIRPSSHNDTPSSYAIHSLEKLFLQSHDNQKRIQTYRDRYQQHIQQIRYTFNHQHAIVNSVFNLTIKKQLPFEIALIPYIESHYNPIAQSKHGASGTWQLMPGTASGFGLAINWWEDQRLNTVLATQAALDYLQYLHAYFNHDWLLAIAAYDAGEGTIKAAIKRNLSLGQPTDFWSLQLPRETMEYVPKLLALAEVINQADIINTNNNESLTTIYVNGQISSQQVATLAHLPLATIHQYNPHLLRGMTPPSPEPHAILIPSKLASAMQPVIQQLSKNPKTHWLRYKVKRGDTLTSLTSRYHTSISNIRKHNTLLNLPLQPGTALLIPANSYNHPPQLLPPTQHSMSKPHHGPIRKSHIISNGDTLHSIAKRYGIRPGMIRYWNPGVTTKLHPESTLTLWLKPRGTYDIYTVKQGDNLSNIAQQVGVSLSSLYQFNPGLQQTIQPGQTLKIPTQLIRTHNTAPQHPLTYTIKPGDSIYRIAHQHSVSSEDIKRWNNLENSTMIHPGQRLTVYR